MARVRAVAAAVNEAASKELFDQDAGKITDKLLATRSWKLYSKEFPVLDVGFQLAGRPELRIRLIADNWNDSPPSVELLDSEGRYLTQPNVPQGPSNVFNRSTHRFTGHPFVCMAGSREYHTHENHLGDLWDNYKHRDSHTLGGLMTQLWNAWLKATP